MLPVVRMRVPASALELAHPYDKPKATRWESNISLFTDFQFYWLDGPAYTASYAKSENDYPFYNGTFRYRYRTRLAQPITYTSSHYRPVILQDLPAGVSTQILWLFSLKESYHHPDIYKAIVKFENYNKMWKNDPHGFDDIKKLPENARLSPSEIYLLLYIAYCCWWDSLYSWVPNAVSTPALAPPPGVPGGMPWPPNLDFTQRFGPDLIIPHGPYTVKTFSSSYYSFHVPWPGDEPIPWCGRAEPPYEIKFLASRGNSRWLSAGTLTYSTDWWKRGNFWPPSVTWNDARAEHTPWESVYTPVGGTSYIDWVVWRIYYLMLLSRFYFLSGITKIVPISYAEPGDAVVMAGGWPSPHLSGQSQTVVTLFPHFTCPTWWPGYGLWGSIPPAWVKNPKFLMYAIKNLFMNPLCGYFHGGCELISKT